MSEIPAEAPAVQSAAHGVRAPGFSAKIAAVFATNTTTLVLGILSSLLIAKLLSVPDRGIVTAVVMIPGLLGAFALFGLPNAVNYFAGRGSSVAGLIRASLLFTVVLSVVLVTAVWFALPVIEKQILHAIPPQYDYLARVALLTLPASMIVAFGGSLMYGRQQVRIYNITLVFQAVTSLLGAAVLVGFLHFGIPGAVATNIFINAASSVLVLFGLFHLHRNDKRGEPPRLRSLMSYGARLYPASLTGYLNYRADNIILQALSVTGLAAQDNLSLYTFAVTMAEVVFLVPSSVASMFLPRVAGSSHEDAAAALGGVARLTLLVSVCIAIALIPVALIGVHLVLPNYVESLPPFLAILPGVVSLSLAKVMTSYIGGRGRPGPASIGATLALLVNVPMNLILIPRIGIVGASLSSVASYTALAAMMVIVASRMSGQSPRALCVPRRSDAAVLVRGVRRMAGRATARVRVRFA